MYYFLFCLLFITNIVCADDESFKPYFASIKSSEVNVRVGPNTRYPIKWVFVNKSEPVEVRAKYEIWVKIRDIEGEEGWVKKNMVSAKKRNIIIIGAKPAPLYKYSNTSIMLAKIKPGKRLELQKCNIDLCLVKVNDQLKGWLSRENIWGIYKTEFIK
jgi:SH3-like domain-containing protein